LHKYYRRRNAKIIKIAKFKIFLIIYTASFIIVSLILLAFEQQLNNKKEKPTYSEIINKYKFKTLKKDDKFLVRWDINKSLESLDESSLIKFYNKYSHNYIISKSILDYSLRYDVPINLSFAVAYVESHFNVKAYNKNVNSIDRGLFQLNNLYRKNWKISDFYNIKKNCKEGIRHLSWCLKVSNNNIIKSIGVYNAGLSKINNLPSSTESYIEKVLEYENYLNVNFNKFLEESNAKKFN